MDCQTERSRSLDKVGHISTPLNLTNIVFRDALYVIPDFTSIVTAH